MKEKQKHAKSALELLKKEDADSLNTLLEKHSDVLSEGAKDSAQPIEKRIESQNALVAQLDALIASPPDIPARAMIPTDVDEPADESIRIAGQFDRVGDKVPRGFPRMISSGTSTEISAGKSGRIEFGRWLTDIDNGAGQLTARVLVNRIWHHLIGRGVVRTVDNFGTTGEAPSHPELLDYLASELIDSGWSIKAIVRKVVLSRTFAMSSGYDEKGHAIDPDNRLLWRAHRRRLDPEALRDAMLAAASQLERSPMQSTVWYLGDQATAVGDNKVRRRTDFPCRSVYLPVIRNDLPELFQVFDFADPHATTGARTQTTVATQGLFILNDTMVMDAAEATARRILADDMSSNNDARLDRMFELILNVRPTVEERNELLTFIQRTKQRLIDEGESEPDIRAWSMACHAVFSLSRFQFLE
jgi:hypothetical protein